MKRRLSLRLSSQRGVFTLIASIVLIVLVGLALRSAFNMAASGVTDSYVMTNGVNALYVAESGLERAIRRFTTGAATCSNLGETQTLTSGETFTITTSTTGFNGSALAKN